jgi:hypothetical protein
MPLIERGGSSRVLLVLYHRLVLYRGRWCAILSSSQVVRYSEGLCVYSCFREEGVEINCD